MSSRHKARSAAVQALYQWDMMGCPFDDITADFLESNERKNMDEAYLDSLLVGVPANCDAIEKAISPFLDRDLSKVDPIERSVLRLSVYEMLFHVSVPVNVVINEGVELAKKFGSDHGFKFVNGILDKLANLDEVKSLRSNS